MKRESRVSFGPGAASLILIIVILSMSILGILALMNASSDSRLSERSARVIESVYALSAQAERDLSDLDAMLAKTAVQGDNFEAVERALPQGMTLEEDVVSWTVTDGYRTLDCAVRLVPGTEGVHCEWTNHRLSAVTEDAWN